MSILHILRSEPDDQLEELIQAVTAGEATTVALYREPIDYDELVQEIFSHDRVISWW